MAMAFCQAGGRNVWLEMFLIGLQSFFFFLYADSKCLFFLCILLQDSFQKILLSICKQAAESSNVYKKHQILTIYHLFVNLLLAEMKDGLGGAWAFVLRDVIYTLIHHINSRSVCDLCNTQVKYFFAEEKT